MGNLIESLLAGLGLMSGALIFLMSLIEQDPTGQIEERSNVSHTRTIHPQGSRLAA